MKPRPKVARIVPSEWEQEFGERLRRFRTADDGASLSIKVRVVSGCFHREHSPSAFALIDRHLASADLDRRAAQWIEHETGPEILVWVSLATVALGLSAAVLNLITAVLKARADGVKAGDRPRDPIEVIVRTSREGNRVVEEKILRLTPEDHVDAEAVRLALNAAAVRLLPPAPSKPPTSKRKPRKPAKARKKRRAKS